MKLNEVSLTKIKQAVVDHILADNYSEGYSEESIALRRAELEDKLLSTQLASSLKLQEGRLNSKAFNEALQELYIDALTTFGYLDALDGTVTRHLKISQSVIASLTAQIERAHDKIDGYEAALSEKESPERSIEGFRDSGSFEPRMDLHTERYGENIPQACVAHFSADEGVLTLPYTRQQNMIVSLNGVEMGSIEIKKQLGSGFAKASNSKNAVEKAVDTSPLSYWSETVLSDEPIRVRYPKERPADPLGLADYYYGIQHGALCELEVNMESVTKLNELQFLPYGPYPVEIVAIRYKTSDDTEEPLQEIVYPDHVDPLLRSKLTKKAVSYRFPEINCKRLSIVLNQIHFTKDSYLVPSGGVFKNELWYSATGQESEKPILSDDLLFKPLYTDRAAEDAAWKYINNLTAKNRNLDVKQLLFGQNDSVLPVTKYEYTYGFHNIAPNFSEFEKTGVYVSNPVQAAGNIKSIRISTEEEHPTLEGDQRMTDIEYYISHAENPSYEDWYPILPVNVDLIPCELLQLYGSVSPLRFPAEEVHDVFYNENRMMVGEDYILNKDVDGNVLSVEVPNFDHFAAYTVSYRPVPQVKELDFATEGTPALRNSFEKMEGRNISHYMLSEYPYFATDSPSVTSVKLVNRYTGDALSEASGQVRCVTNPFYQGESYKNFDRASSKVQYYTDGNRLYFDREVSDEYTIEINYQHFVSKVRLKSIFRRNSHKHNWMSPSLAKVTYEFVTVD